MTLIGTHDDTIGGGRESFLWGLASPAVGTHTVSLPNAQPNGYAVSMSFIGASQVGTYVSDSCGHDTDNASAFYSLAVPSASGDLVVDVVNEYGTTITVDASQTQRMNNQSVVTIAVSTKAATGTTTAMTWTLGEAVLWSNGAVSVKP
jgi:hypothetical protein